MRTKYNDPIIGHRVLKDGELLYILDTMENAVTRGYISFHRVNGTLMGLTDLYTEIVYYDAGAYNREHPE